MAGSLHFTAVLDACVLYPAPLRDLLLSLGEDGLYRPRWTLGIQQEWIRNLRIKRPELDPGRLERTAELMASVVEDCLVENAESIVDCLNLPDPDDRHVLAAAIIGHADAIVTFNLKDFPKDITQLYGIEVLHPDDFLVAQYHLDPIGFLSVVKAQRERLRNPPKSAVDHVATLEQQGLPQTGKLLREAIELI